MSAESALTEHALARLLAIAEKLDERGNHYDEEPAHSDADDVLKDLLRSLGYGVVVDAYDKIPKWFA